METSSTSKYLPPVDQLLTYGEGRHGPPQNWPNYLELGLGPEQIPDLIHMATDEQLNLADPASLEVWAPTHAWRALGQLHAEAAIEPLLSLFDALEDDDWAREELPEVFGMIGPAALPALAAYVADSIHDEWARISAIRSVERIGIGWPEARRECIALLSEQLERFTENEIEINSFLIVALVELQAKEAAPLMEQAFAARRVDPLVMGDWEDVQVELGLESPEEVEQRQPKRLAEALFPSTAHEKTFPHVPAKTVHERQAAHRKSKSKMAKQSRKKNRKR